MRFFLIMSNKWRASTIQNVGAWKKIIKSEHWMTFVIYFSDSNGKRHGQLL